MNPWLIGALIWGVGALVSFRWEAWFLVARKNWRRDKAVREARNSALFWPLVVIIWFLDGAFEIGKRLVLAGIPESRADRDEAIRRLEEEVLGVTAQDARDEAAGQLHLTLQEALNGTTGDEDADELLRQDMAYLDRLDKSRGICGPDTRLPSGKTMGQISPAYRPPGYVSTHRPDRHRRNAAPDSQAGVNNARRALELLRRLAAMGATKDPFTGQKIHAAIRDARHHLQDAESGHLTANQTQALRRQVTQLERLVRSHEAIKDDDKAKVCTRCGCPVVQGRLGYIHIPTLGGPSACHSATIAPEAAVPWYQTPADSPEREAVRKRTEERLRRMESEEVTSISLDGTETTYKILPEGYEVTSFLAGTRDVARQVNQGITEWFEDSTLPVTRKIHRERHKDAPNTLCPFCNMEALQ